MNKLQTSVKYRVDSQFFYIDWSLQHLLKVLSRVLAQKLFFAIGPLQGQTSKHVAARL